MWFSLGNKSPLVKCCVVSLSVSLFYQKSVSHSTRCPDNYLQLNKAQTKELVISTSNTPGTGLTLASVHGKTLEQVDFKSLGLTIDKKLRFDQHITSLHKRSQQRLHVVRKLRALITPSIITSHYGHLDADTGL